MGDADGLRRTPTGGERRELVVSRPGRVDAVLAAAHPDLSRARVQRLIESGAVTVNGELVRKSGQVQEGDLIALDLEPVAHDITPVDVELPVLYEDGALLVIDKPPGLAVHGAPGDTGPSIAGWLLARLGEAAASGFDAEHPGVVHRLDKDTSGVLLLAKSPAAQAALSRAFEERTAQKTYLALCDGLPRQPRAVVDAALGRHPGDRTKMAIAKQGRESRTGFELIADDGEKSLLLVRPETGRTHQIRVHLAAVGVPVRFDRVYGLEAKNPAPEPEDGRRKRQMLHAWRLAIPHPAGGTLTVTSPLPGDMRAELREWRLEEAALPYCEVVPAVVAPS